MDHEVNMIGGISGRNPGAVGAGKLRAFTRLPTANPFRSARLYHGGSVDQPYLFAFASYPISILTYEKKRIF